MQRKGQDVEGKGAVLWEACTRCAEAVACFNALRDLLSENGLTISRPTDNGGTADYDPRLANFRLTVGCRHCNNQRRVLTEEGKAFVKLIPPELLPKQDKVR